MAKKFFTPLMALTLTCMIGLLGCESSTSSDDDSDVLGVPGNGGGFLWKPVSESDGNLVVLLPHEYRKRLSYCRILTADGTLLEDGRFHTDTHNGDRPHYRFSEDGGFYGDGVYVVCLVDEGTESEQIVHWLIPDGSARYEM